MIRRSTIAAALSWACGMPDQSLEALPRPDRAQFAAVVGPILTERCGSSNCHGRDERPFPLFATQQRRLAPIASTSKEPLTDAEVSANYDATLGLIDAPDPLQTVLILKSLGKLGHGGGAVFEHRSDPECRALREWIAGGDP